MFAIKFAHFFKKKRFLSGKKCILDSLIFRAPSSWIIRELKIYDDDVDENATKEWYHWLKEHK